MGCRGCAWSRLSRFEGPNASEAAMFGVRAATWCLGRSGGKIETCSALCLLFVGRATLRCGGGCLSTWPCTQRLVAARRREGWLSGEAVRAQQPQSQREAVMVQVQCSAHSRVITAGPPETPTQRSNTRTLLTTMKRLPRKNHSSAWNKRVGLETGRCAAGAGQSILKLQ